MGTSQSRRDPPGGAPLVPAWAAQDPVPPGPHPAEEEPPPAMPAPAVAAGLHPQELAEPRRYASFRIALGRFASNGSRDDARTALGHWGRTSVGGARSYTNKVARASRTGGAALAGLGQAAQGQPPVAGALDIRTLAGQPLERAVSQIVDAFCPPGILDEELARLAIGEALIVALAGVDDFDPTAINANALRLATLTFAAELVFLSVAGDAGQSLAAADTPTAAAQRESDIRALVREVTDVIGTPIFEAAAGLLTPQGMSSLVSRLVEAVVAEMATWQ